MASKRAPDASDDSSLKDGLLRFSPTKISTTRTQSTLPCQIVTHAHHHVLHILSNRHGYLCTIIGLIDQLLNN